MLAHAVAVPADVDHVAVMHEPVDEGFAALRASYATVPPNPPGEKSFCPAFGRSDSPTWGTDEKRPQSKNRGESLINIARRSLVHVGCTLTRYVNRRLREVRRVIKGGLRNACRASCAEVTAAASLRYGCERSLPKLRG